jgi:hypothetical protein
MMYVSCICGQEVSAAEYAAGSLRTCPTCARKIRFPATPSDARQSAMTDSVKAAAPLRAIPRRVLSPLRGEGHASELQFRATQPMSVPFSCQILKTQTASGSVSG